LNGFFGFEPGQNYGAFLQPFDQDFRSFLSFFDQFNPDADLRDPLNRVVERH